MDVRGVPARLRVLIAEDQYLTREGTRRLLEERDELEVVGVASDLGSVLEQARRLLPDVIVMLTCPAATPVTADPQPVPRSTIREARS